MAYTSLLDMNSGNHTHEISDINELQTTLNNIPSLPISISDGGTGATTAEQARNNLGITDAITSAIANLGSLKIKYGKYSGFSSDYKYKSLKFECDGYPIVFVTSGKSGGTTTCCVRGGQTYTGFECYFSNNYISLGAAYGKGPTNSEDEYDYFILMT